MTGELRLTLEGLSALNDWMLEQICSSEPGATLAIALRGATVFSNAYGMADVRQSRPLEIDSALDAGSIMKMLTGLAVCTLELEGLVSRETRLKEILPEFPAFGDALQLRHLLHHESGLRNYTVLLYYMAGWHEQAPPPPNVVYESICRSGSLSFEPGARYEYCDTNYFLLAQVIERVTGRRFGAFVEERFLAPLGMDDSVILDHPDSNSSSWAEGHINYPSKLDSPHAYRAPEAFGDLHPARLCYTHVGAEGLRTSARDLVTLGEHLVGPSDVISDRLRELAVHVPRMRDDGFGYGAGLNVGRFRGMRFLGHSGAIQGFTATLACFPDERLTISCMTNRQDMGAWSCRDWVLDALMDQPSKSLASVAQGHEEAVTDPGLSGLYLDPISACFAKISSGNDGLSISLNGQPGVLLSGNGPWETDDGLTVIALGTANGRATKRLIIQQDHVSSEFLGFSEVGDVRDFSDYEGIFACDALQARFLVQATADGIRLTNQDAAHPSMDLDYAPTIPDFFWSHDPHPGLSQLQFLRRDTDVHAFVYRDFDGDRREDFAFQREATP